MNNCHLCVISQYKGKIIICLLADKNAFIYILARFNRIILREYSNNELSASFFVNSHKKI